MWADQDACVLLEGGVVRCWGDNEFGQVGVGNTMDIGDTQQTLPVPAIDVGGVAVDIWAGRQSTCALLENNDLRCWGLNDSGQLGVGHTNNIGDEPGEMPPASTPIPNNVIMGTSGTRVNCVLTQAGTVHCWGESAYGQQGNGDGVLNEDLGDEPGELPTPAVNLGSDAEYIEAGHNHVCAINEYGQLKCWGNGGHGKLGNENTVSYGWDVDHMPPTTAQVGIADLTGVLGGNDHTCAWAADGNPRCWGLNNTAQLGQGKGGFSIGSGVGSMPVDDTDLGGQVMAVDGLYHHLCAIVPPGNVKCWGSPTYGLLTNDWNNPQGDNPNEMPPNNIDLPGNAVQIAVGWGFALVVLEDGTLRYWGRNFEGQCANGDNQAINSWDGVELIEMY